VPISRAQLLAAFQVVRQVLPEALLVAFLEKGQGKGPGVPGFEHYVNVAVIHTRGSGAETCFLCRNGESKSNPVKVGDLALARTCWNLEGGRDAYERRWVLGVV
jgi:hypothetical protein